jgi:hypothetical protein
MDRNQLSGDALSIARRMEEVLVATPPGVPTACLDLAHIEEYERACRSVGIETSVLYADSRDRIDTNRATLTQLGIDVSFPSGSYSFINGVYLPRNKALVDFIDSHRNQFGLFCSFPDAVRFMTLHSSLEGELGLEPLDDAIPVSLSIRRAP